MSATISASMVKDLREKTGAGMMECKKALQETAGDMDAAVKHLRERGIAKGEKRAGRVAAEGVVAIASTPTAAAIIELNSETDFVARNEEFQATANAIAKAALNARSSDLAAVSGLMLDGIGKTAADAVADLLAKIGEKITLSRVAYLEGDRIGSYVHMNGKIGTIVAAKVASVAAAKADEVLVDVAMHTAASAPRFMFESEVDTKTLENEKDIFAAQARQEGKPDNIIPRIVEGKIKSFYKENLLPEQAFVKDPKVSVKQYVESSAKSAGGTMELLGFVRFQVGELAEQPAAPAEA